MTRPQASPAGHRSRHRAGRHPWVAAALVAAAASACAPPRAADELAGHNLLLVTIDTLRADRVGAYGDAHAETPNLDRLAREGILFANCYSPVPLTLPAHASLFTARLPFTIGVRNNGSYLLRDQEVTLAERLEEAGLETAAVVSTFILGSKFGLGQGFEVYDDALGSEELIRSFTSDIPADRVVERFRTWLAGPRRGRFFAWLHFYDPHQPYTPPSPFRERYADDPYRGEVAFVDHQIGAVLDELERRGLLDSTLIAVTSDHGEAFGEHGETGHGILTYDESLRVPLVLWAGDRLTPRRVEERVRLVDLAPTLLELLGLEPLDSGEGRSLAALAWGGGEQEDREVYFESLLGHEDNGWAPITGLIDGRYKYFALPEAELYDLAADPGERQNLYARRRDTARRIDRRLRELLLSGAAPAARREPSAAEAERLRALGYLGTSAARAERPLDPKQGIRIDARVKEVRALLDAGELEAAAAALDATRAASPEIDMPVFYALEHEILARRDDPTGAVAALERGSRRFPDSERLPFLLAHYSLRSGRLDEVERLAGELLARNPRFSQAIILLARAAEQRGDLATAISRYREALALEPLSPPLRLSLADALVSDGRLEPALELFNRLADEGLLDAEPRRLFQAAVLNGHLGANDRAKQLFRRGLELEPAGIHQLGFALLLAQLGERQEARRQLDTALGRYGSELNAEQTALARGLLEQLRADG